MNNIIDSITEAYGVDEEDVEILIEYSSSGTIDIDIPKDLINIENNETLVEFLQLLEEELASDLGIHVKDLELFYNETSGEIEYILISSNFTEIEELLMELEKDDFVSQLNNTISENYPGVSIDSFEQNEEKGIEVEISVTVDTTDASENLKKANEIIEEKLIEELGFEEADSKTMFIASMPTAFPTRIPTSRPTTTMPTSRPSITGAIISIEIGGSLTKELSSKELETMTETIKEQYGISDEEFVLETKYKVRGTLNVSLPEDIPIEEAFAILEESLSELLNIHPSQIELKLNEDGDVIYVISSDTFDDASTIQTELSTETFVSNLENDVQEEIPSFELNTIIPATELGEIEVEVSITLDATNANKLDNADDVVQNMAKEQFDLNATILEYFLTAAPTRLPSAVPTTSIPSATPSLTGTVVVISLSSEVEEELSSTEIDRLRDIVIDSYGLDPEKDPISTTVDYSTSGTMTMEGIIGSELSPEELEALEDSMENTLSEILGVPSENIDLIIDPETGVVTYTISSPTFNETQTILDQLKTDPISFVDEFTTALVEDLAEQNIISSEIVENISITSVDADDQIVADVTVVIDEEDVTKSQILAENTVDVLVGENYEVSAEITFISSAPTVVPSLSPSSMPTTIFPTSMPTITGDVALVELTKPVRKSLTTEEVENIIKQAEELYEVNPGDVSADVNYVTRGTMTIDIDLDEYDGTLEDLEQSIIEALSQELGVHEKDINVHIDPETNIVSYELISDSAEDSKELQNLLYKPEVVDAIATNLNELIPEVSSLEISPAYEIEVEIDLIVDTTNTPSATNSTEAFIDVYEDLGFGVDINNTYIQPKETTKIDMNYRQEIDFESLSSQDENRLIELIAEHLEMNIWDVFIRGFKISGAEVDRRELSSSSDDSNMKSQLLLDVTSYDKKSLNTRLSAADGILWVDLQLDINSEFSTIFTNSELFEVCFDGICIAITMPTTTIIPSVAPTISGLIVVLEVSKAVDSQLTSEEEEILTSTILSAYNVSSSEVEIELDYTTSGSITIADIPADLSVEEIEEAVIESLSESLGVHPKDIEIISIDPESGKIEFEIKGDSFEEAKAIQELISNVDGESKFSNDLKSSLSEVLPGSSVTTISSDPIIEVEANIVIDASDAKSNLKDANEKNNSRIRRSVRICSGRYFC